jgi:hypothetical protein
VAGEHTDAAPALVGRSLAGTIGGREYAYPSPAAKIEGVA